MRSISNVANELYHNLLTSLNLFIIQIIMTWVSVLDPKWAFATHFAIQPTHSTLDTSGVE